MNREIKFRAWDIKNKRMIRDVWHLPLSVLTGTDDSEPEELMGDDGQRTNYYELMQYTGLKDKNGKEIYEGDILKVDDLIEEGRFIFSNLVVKYEPAHFYAHHEKGNNLENFKYYGFDNSHIDSDGINVDRTVEIIGNIYENSDLLKP